MPVGLQIVNANGEFTVSTDAKFLHLLGKAVYQSTTQASGDSNSIVGWQGGYSTYRLSIGYDTTIYMAMDLPLGYVGSITGMDRIGVGEYIITVFCIYGNSQVPVDMWAFGFAGVSSGNYGLQLFNAQKKLVADFGYSNHLFPRARVNAQSVGVDQTIPALARPAIIGMVSYYWADIYPNGGSTGWLYTYNQIIGCWARWAPTSLRVSRIVRKTSQENDFPTDDFANTDTPSFGFVIEAANLP